MRHLARVRCLAAVALVVVSAGCSYAEPLPPVSAAPLNLAPPLYASLPQEVKDGVKVEDKVFEFGNIAPGCVGMNVSGQYTGVAIPPTRILEVCESLNVADDPATETVNEEAVRCCVESICDENFSAAIQCLTGALADVSTPQG